MFYCDVGTSWILYHVFPRKTFLFLKYCCKYLMFFELWPLPSDSFFSNFTFLGCFCFWMVEFLDFSPFKFTLSKLCKTYHLILQTSYTEKYSLHLWLWTPHVLQKYIPTMKQFSKISLCLFIDFNENVTSFLIHLKLIWEP